MSNTERPKHPGGRPKVFTAPFTVRLEPAAHEDVLRLAEEEGRTPANMLRRLIDEALALRKRRQPRARPEEEA